MTIQPMRTDDSMPAFQRYQLSFTGHIRDPQHQPKPDKVAARRMRVYTEIVFNNLYGAVSACFPVAQKVLGKRAWTQLVRGFFAGHQATTPLFREIPHEFLRYLETRRDLPAYLYPLAHYEWIELAIASANIEDDMTRVDIHGDLLAGVPVFAAASALLRYDYPVHRISPRFKPQAPLDEPLHFLVFRDAADLVRFIELNPVTARLLGLLHPAGQTDTMTSRQALLQIAAELHYAEPEVIVGFGAQILHDLKGQGALLGIRPAAV